MHVQYWSLKSLKILHVFALAIFSSVVVVAPAALGVAVVVVVVAVAIVVYYTILNSTTTTIAHQRRRGLKQVCGGPKLQFSDGHCKFPTEFRRTALNFR